MTGPSVVVFDYGSGNTRSAVRALERAGASVTLTADRSAAMDCDGLVVPGVGAFRACVDGLRAAKGHEIIGRRLAGGRPVLGICVGMQVLFEHGVEHGVDTPGLDEWPGVVERLQAPVVPHMGWNTVEVPEGSTLFDGIAEERFYFVHSYGVRDWTLRTNNRTRPPLVTWASHGGDRFVAAVENGPLTATQFHPEKSGDAGAALLRNWVAVARPMSKERAQRRAAREHEAALKASARAAEQERRERRAARCPRRQARHHRPVAADGPGPGGPPARSPGVGGSSAPCVLAVLVALNLLVWVVRPDWAARLAALVVSVLAAPVLVTLLVPRRR